MTVDDVAELLGSPGASEADIAAFEAIVGARLPEDYRRFLSRTRGGSLPRHIQVFQGEKGDHDEYIAEISGLGPGGDLTKEAQAPRWGRLPEGLVWIGKGRGGDPIALSLHPDFRGKVYLVDHEVMPGANTEEGAIAVPMPTALEDGVAILLASSFTAFVQALGPQTD